MTSRAGQAAPGRTSYAVRLFLLLLLFRFLLLSLVLLLLVGVGGGDELVEPCAFCRHRSED
jgi:hypothetical protein